MGVWDSIVSGAGAVSDAYSNNKDLINTGIAVGGSIYANQQQADAAEAAAQAQIAGYDQASQMQADAYNQQREDYAPYRDVGPTGLAGLMSQAQGTYDGTQSPYYKYANDELTRSINREMGARGGYNSSGAVDALTRMRSGLLADDYNMMNNQYLNLANLGRGATTSTANAGQTTATSLSNLAASSGTASGNAINQAGQANASMYSNLAALPMQVTNNYDYLKSIGQR